MRNSHNLTEHAQKRKQQRGISDLQMELIRYFGVDHYQKGGCSLSYIDEKMIKQLRSASKKIERINWKNYPNTAASTARDVSANAMTPLNSTKPSEQRATGGSP